MESELHFFQFHGEAKAGLRGVLGIPVLDSIPEASPTKQEMSRVADKFCFRFVVFHPEGGSGGEALSKRKAGFDFLSCYPA